ncbi:hypothetical protein H2248_012124 [Termitomyces sp. 'cryptogamus']|nr:hypothetical protein H2248_012124 [Termitomyces sp. 'cryptogamus']
MYKDISEASAFAETMDWPNVKLSTAERRRIDDTPKEEFVVELNPFYVPWTETPVDISWTYNV